MPVERSEVDPRTGSEVVPGEGQSQCRGQRSFPRKVNPSGEVRGRSKDRVISRYRGMSIPREKSELDPEEGSGSEFNPDMSEVNPSMFLLLAHLISGTTVIHCFTIGKNKNIPTNLKLAVF